MKIKKNLKKKEKMIPSSNLNLLYFEEKTPANPF